MNTPCLSFRNALLALALSSAPVLASAGVIEVEYGEGNVPALLYADATAYTDAMYGAVIELQPDLLGPGRGKALRVLTSKVHGATLGRFEYTYKDADGASRTRVYHARSGHSLKASLDIAARKKGGNSGSESSAGESSTPESGEESTGASSEDIAVDRSEGRFCPPDTTSDKRAVKLPPEDSVLDSLDIGDGMNHSWDAELKALRSIEADINSRAVPRGGKLTGYVSKAVCESCRSVIDTFAEEFDVDGTVYQLIEPGVREVIPDFSTPLSRSKASSAEFKSSRKAYVRDQFARKGRARPAPGDWTDELSLDQLEAEEASALSEASEMCGRN